MLNANVSRKRRASLAIAFCLTFVPILQAVANENEILAPGKGRELVQENCTVCHSAAIILQNHMTRAAWDKTITWMQQKQGLWELETSVRKTILDYLSQQQGVNQKPANETADAQKNPMYEFDYRPNPL